MRKWIKKFGLVMKWGTFLSTLGFVVAILIQIFARLFLTSAPSWTEEAARVFFVIGIGFSAGLALRSGAYVNFNFLFRKMNGAWQWRISLLINLVTVVLFGLFTIYALRFMLMGWGERSPSLKLPMSFPFAGMFIMGLSLLVYSIDRLVQMPPRPSIISDDAADPVNPEA